MPHVKPPETTSELASPKLDALADEIRTEIAAAEADFESSVTHAIRVGGLLTEAKAKVGHGRWLAWLRANFPRSIRSAQGYMRLASDPANAQGLARLGIEGALRQLAALTAPIADEEIAEAVRGGDSRRELAEHLDLSERAVSDAVIRDELRQRADTYERPNIAQPHHQPEHQRIGIRVVTGGRSNDDDHGEITLPRPRRVHCPHCGETHECRGYWGPKSNGEAS